MTNIAHAFKKLLLLDLVKNGWTNGSWDHVSNDNCHFAASNRTFALQGEMLHWTTQIVWCMVLILTECNMFATGQVAEAVVGALNGTLTEQQEAGTQVESGRPRVWE